MNRVITDWFSSALQKNMPIVSYGDACKANALLLLPTAAADYLEYERFRLIDSLSPFIDNGKFRVFSVNSINSESWLNNNMLPEHKAIRHNQFNAYIFNDVIPFIRQSMCSNTMVFVGGASFGALHAMNLFMKRPDIINGAISMSGVYDLAEYTKGYWDEQVYFNSPWHYLKNLTDDNILKQIKDSHHIHIYSGSGSYEDPQSSKDFSELLWKKNIWNDLSIWGHDVPHDWDTWRKMLPYILETKF
ncbi:MAG: alpha/beta hydrolase-fold protein [Phycisphaerales bacterium]|nr:alpha/beta hydrolase-fold protein [Phycisphaerales bacterium]